MLLTDMCWMEDKFKEFEPDSNWDINNNGDLVLAWCMVFAMGFLSPIGYPVQKISNFFRTPIKGCIR